MNQLALGLAPEVSPLTEPTERVPAPEPEVAEEPEGPLDLVAPAGTQSAFDTAFQAMAWAEEAIQEMSEAHPGRAELLDRAFIALRPRSDLFRRRMNERVLRGHMDELLRRVVENGERADMAPATGMEGLCVMSELGQRAPLKHRWFMAKAVLFLDVFGHETATEMLGEEMVRRADMDREQHLIAEIIAEVRHKVRDDERQKAWKEAVAR